MPNTAKNPRHRPIDLQKRTAILDAARDEFFVHGFAAASIEAIAEASNVSKVTIYNRFGTKEVLFSNVVERECFLMSTGLDAPMLNHISLSEQLVDFGERAMRFLMQPHIIRFERRIASESENMPEVGELFLNAGPRQMRQKLVDLIDRAIANQSIKPCDSGLAAGHLYGMLIGFDLILSRFSTEPPHDALMSANVKIAVDAFLEAYSL